MNSPGVEISGTVVAEVEGDEVEGKVVGFDAVEGGKVEGPEPVAEVEEGKLVEGVKVPLPPELCER